MAYSAEVMQRARARLAAAKADRESENQQHLAEGYARVEDNADGSRTVIYSGVNRGAYLARGTLQECAMRILKVILNSAAMDDLKARQILRSK